jgi:hypothetical protein
LDRTTGAFVSNPNLFFSIFFVQSNMKDMGLPDIYKVTFEISLIKENDEE